MTTAIANPCQSKQQFRWLYPVFVIVVLDIVLTVVFLIWSQQTSRLEDHVQADGAVLLFAGMGSQERINESDRRIFEALELYESGVVSEILAVGGYRQNLMLSGSELYRRKLHQLGVPERDLSVEGLSYDTRSNIKYALSILEDKHWDSVVFVSSPTHLLRVRHYLKRYPSDLEISFSGYNYLTAQPAPGILELWYRVHSEWAIYFMYFLLDDDQFGDLVRAIRLGPEMTQVFS
ncbi:MAG: YdcF family protein [Gammaproteobacteria bacterium]|nr:YdcF family protein [Gammaproteobacteria bacterium]